MHRRNRRSSINDYNAGRDLVRSMLNHSLTNEEFRHAQHMELAYYYLVRHEYDVAVHLIALSIRDFAAFHGHAQKFHMTLTVCWARFVAAAMNAQNPIPPFAQILVLHPQLLNKELPTHYYSKPLLLSQAARDAFVEPDVHPLPEMKELVPQ